MKAVIVDMGNPRWIRALGVSTGKTPRLNWYEAMMIDEGEKDPWPILQKMLAKKSALDWPLCWMPSREQVGSAVLTLPPIPRREISKVLPRELGQLTEASQELAAAFVLGDRVEEKGAVKQEVISAYMPRAQLYGSLDQMRSIGLTPRWVIPEMAGHLQLLEKLKKNIKEKLSGTVLFEVGAMKIAMTIYRGMAWGLERVFTYRHEEEGLPGEDELSRISVELNRTLQFFKQRFRGVNVDRLIIYGQSEAQHQIAEHIRTSHALHVISAEQAVVGERMDMGAFGGDAHECLSSALIALQLIPLLGGKSELDLFPPGYLERDRLRSRILGLGISYGLIAALLSVASFYLRGVRGEYRSQIATLVHTVSLQETQNEHLQQTRKRRTFYYQWEHFTLWPRRYSAISADFVRQLTLMVTPEIVLSELSVEPKTHGAAFLLKGHISVADSIAAQSIFIRFFDQIKALPNILSLDSSNVKVNSARESTGRSYTAEALPKQSAVELYFSINGEMEWP